MIKRIKKFFGGFLVFLMIGSGMAWSHNTWYGPTGLIQIPTPTILRSQEAAASVYSTFGGGDNHFGWSGAFSFSDQVELSLSDTAGLRSRTGSSTIFGLKYVPTPNLAVGVLMDSNSRFQHTAYAVLGSPENSVYLGTGMNFGNGSARVALLGNYSRVKRDMETIFFLAGARMDLSRYYPSLEAVAEFNGDTMSLGLGLIPETNWDVQLDYMTSGDLFLEERFVLSLGTRF
jgi:hypothetical protein